MAHYPVLYKRIIEVLDPFITGNAPKLIADWTLGAGGHTAKILEKFPNAYITGCDIDPETLPIVEENVAKYKERVCLEHRNYADFDQLQRFSNVFPEDKKFDAVIIDLGMSSIQLDTVERGFSFTQDGPIDMRFNRQDSLAPTAKIIVNNASELELTEIFATYGEEKHARFWAEMIVKYRGEKEIETTKQLSDILNYALFIGKSFQKFKSISKWFQALRIKTNSELLNLNTFLGKVLHHLESPGVLITLSFHSLESRAVFRAMNEWHGQELISYWSRKEITADEEEKRENSRSSSAVLRYAISH